jgi:Flp pilus assembly protein TadG
MLKLLRRFRKNRDGLAALEFALIAPVMIAMFYGAIELSSAVDCNARVTRVASTTADLVAQATTVSTTDITNIFNCASAILYPYTGANAKIVISSLVDNGSGGTKVAWSNATGNATARSVGSTVTVPSGLVVSGSGGSVIFTEITYTYAPPISLFLGGSVTLHDSFYARPRRSLTVTHT